MVFNNVLEAVGNTPLIKLNRMVGPDDANVYVKFEGVNIGGSIKTRTALAMVEAAERDGKLIPGKSTICEPTSGNQGVGIALVGAAKGYKVKIVMPDSVSEERRKLVQQYGGEVVLVHDEGDIGKAIDECLQTALRFAKEDPNVFVPQQFVNPANPEVHYAKTGQEILKQVDGPIHGFCSGFGTGGSMSGVGKALREKNPDCEIWVLEPENAVAILNHPIGSHMQMGIGDGFVPENLDTTLYNEHVIITDDEALETSRRLAREEGILAGVSSGTNVFAALKMAKKLGKGKTVVTLLPDTGERYCSTILFG